MPRIVVLGGHSAVARSLRECLQERSLTAELVWATTTEHLESPLVLIDAALLASADLCVLAFRGPVAEGLAQELLRKKKLVIDLAEVGPKAPFLWPTLAPKGARGLDGYHRLPVGMALPLVELLLALQPFLPEQATITTLESAAVADQPGIDELSEQVRAVFTMQEPAPKVFGTSLAFDVLPYGHEDGLKEAIWDGLRVAGARPTSLALTRLLVPTFSADAAVVELILGAPPGKEALEEALSDARGLMFDDEVVSSREALERDDSLVGKLSVEGRRVRVFLACDRLRRGSATQAALALELWTEAEESDGQSVSEGDGDASA